LAKSTFKQLWKKDYFQTVFMILLIVGVVLGLWYGLRLFLNNDYPILAVASGSMHLPRNTACDGWSHPFDPTLHTGDLIVVQGVKPEDIYAAPYNESGQSGDILVFRTSDKDDLIVHRAVDKIELNGTIQFITQGDHNLGPGPGSPTPATAVIGKVVMRIPWIGHVALFMRNSIGVYVIIALVALLIIVEFAVPVFRKKPIDTEIPPESSNESSAA